MAAQLTSKFESRNKAVMTSEILNYGELLAMPQWEIKRKLILIRDGYKCRNCGGEKRLQVHHRQYHINRFGEKVKPWDYANHYLVTLCDECHKNGHELYKVPVYKLS
jgi:hypothetical protein